MRKKNASQKYDNVGIRYNIDRSVKINKTWSTVAIGRVTSSSKVNNFRGEIMDKRHKKKPHSTFARNALKMQS
jgi:hypothetical protein